MNAPAAGPLVVSKTNPRYFEVEGERRAVYLTGSHIWSNFHDGMGPGPECSETPEILDYGDYLSFLKEHGHNFIRLWRWEQFQSQAAGGGFHLCMTPQPWARTGPGEAKDGKPKFDLEKLDGAFFTRLRDRVERAGAEGIYVAVMFFEGWAMHLSPLPDNVEGHPFHAASNINGIGIESIVDYQVLPLDPRVQALQETYMRRVVDTVHDLPNVLWEVANESSGQTADSLAMPGGMDPIPTRIGDSAEWQYWVMDFVRAYEREKGYGTHPFGMTFQFPVPDQKKANEPLYKSTAEWISPGFDDELSFDEQGPKPGRWYTDPPANDGAKIVVADTDHFAPGRGDALWAWKAFLRGQHPILMDFGLIDGIKPANPTPGVPPYDAFEGCRFAMGDTLQYAERMNLLEMEPRGDLTSTRYALANPGEEYLVLQPEEGPFDVTVEPGTYAAEFYSVFARETSEAGKMEIEAAGKRNVTASMDGPAVLYLKRL